MPAPIVRDYLRGLLFLLGAIAAAAAVAGLLMLPMLWWRPAILITLPAFTLVMLIPLTCDIGRGFRKERD